MKLDRIVGWLRGWCPRYTLPAIQRKTHILGVPRTRIVALPILLVIIAFPLTTNIIWASSPHERLVFISFWELKSRRGFSDVEIQQVRGLKGVVNAYRWSSLWLERGVVEGIEFEEAGPKEIIYFWSGGRHLPPLVKGEYPIMGEDALLEEKTARILGLGIGSNLSVLGSRLRVVGMVRWGGGDYFRVFIPYAKLMELRGNYSVLGDAQRYEVKLALSKPGTVDSGLFVIADGYDSALRLKEGIPLQLKETLYSGPYALEAVWTMLWYQRASKVVYAIGFVALGVVGLPRFWVKIKRRIEFLTAFPLWICGLAMTLFLTFNSGWLHYYSLSAYTIVYGVGFLSFPITSFLLSMGLIVSLFRRHISAAVFNGLAAAIGWSLQITIVLSLAPNWGDPSLPLFGIIFLIYPILPALGAVMMTSSHMPDEKASSPKKLRSYLGV